MKHYHYTDKMRVSAEVEEDSGWITFNNPEGE